MQFNKLPREIQGEISQWLSSWKDIQAAIGAGIHVSEGQLMRVARDDHRQKYNGVINFIKYDLSYFIVSGGIRFKSGQMFLTHEGGTSVLLFMYSVYDYCSDEIYLKKFYYGPERVNHLRKRINWNFNINPDCHTEIITMR